MKKDILLKLNLVNDNEWLDSYISIINDNLNTTKQKYKTQKHHIIPRYYYKTNKLTINNSNDNIVNLSFKDHILAHYYLARCSINDYYAGLNYNAIQYTLSKQNIDNKNIIDNLKLFINSLDNIQELYECAMKLSSSDERRRRISDATKLAMQRPEVKAKLMNRPGSNLGKVFTDEHKKKISDSLKGKIPWNKGKKMSSEYCELHSKCQIGVKHKLTDNGRRSLIIKRRNSYKSKDTYKKIQCVETGVVYDFCSDAAYELFPNRSKIQNKIVAQNISKCCKGLRKSAYKFTWRYYEE